MALNNLGLGFVFTATDRASNTIGRVGGQFDQTAARARLGSGIIRAGLVGIGAAAAATAAGVGTLVGAFRLANVAGEFGQTMARVGALTRATSEDMNRLRQSAIEAGIATQFSPREAAEGLAELGVRGLNATESMNALQGSLDLAAGGQISVARSSSTLAAALRVFSLSAEDAGITTDQLLRISNVTALQAGDLEIALGNVARGAGVAQQSIEEMLPAVGLVRNTGVEASSAATGVSTALIRMSQRAADFRRLGVEVTDANGRFRPFLDVVRETDIALRGRFTNSARRAEEATRLFGVRGLGAFQAVANQLNGQIRDTEGRVLDSAEAIEYLRDSMVNAGGAAAEFRERMLDTFEGQKTLLRGTVETLQTVTGEAFGRVFRPFVTSLTNLLNLFIQVWTGLPQPIQTAIAGVVVALGGLLTVFGSATALGLGIAIIIPFLKVIAITLGVVLIALLPLIAAMGALAAAAVAVGLAVRENVGGIGDFFTDLMADARLLARGIRQLFADGGFSGAVREEMGRAENQGIRAFAINVFAIGFRIRRFFEGLAEGFSEGLEAARPAVDNFVSALMALGRAFGFVTDGADGLAGSDSNRFMGEGRRGGETLARALEFVVHVLTSAVSFFEGFVRVASRGIRVLEPTFRALGTVVRALAVAFGMLGGEVAAEAKEGAQAGNVWQALGEVLGVVVVGAIKLVADSMIIMGSVLAVVVASVALFARGARTSFRVVANVVDALTFAFLNLGDQVQITMTGLVASVLSAFRALPEVVRTRLGITGETETRMLTAQRQAEARVAVRNSTQSLRAAERLPAGAERDRAMAGARADQRAAMVTLARELGRRPVQVQATLQVDSETVARASARGERASDAGGFRAPVALGPED